MTSITLDPGLIRLPETQIAASARTERTKPNYGYKYPSALQLMSGSPTNLHTRFTTSGVDLTFRLVAENKGIIRENHSIGRIWTPHYPGIIKFTVGGLVKEIHLQPATAYAGFRHGIADPAALRSLAAVSQTLGIPADRSYLADDARAGINKLVSQPFQPIRMLVRMAALWAAAATAEGLGSDLYLHTAIDDRTPTTIRTLGEWGLCVAAAARGTEQPLLVNLRGADESARFARLARILCLDAPTFAQGRTLTPPTVSKLWPPIANARAYAMTQQDQMGILEGIITSRDMGIMMTYYARSWNAEDQLAEAISLAAGFAYRPAGSAVMGQVSRANIALPASLMGPAALLPITQAVDVLDSEDLRDEFFVPRETLFSATGVAATYLAAMHNTLATTGHLWGDVHRTLRPLIERWLAQLLRPSTTGSPAAHATVSLMQDLGLDGNLPSIWAGVTPATSLEYWKHLPVEIEECLPWVKKLADTSSLLGTLMPSRLVDLVPYNTHCTVAQVIGRKAASDAFYSLKVQAPGTLMGYRIYERGNYMGQFNYTPKLSYRGIPTDGQFLPLEHDGIRVVPTFRLPNAESVLAARSSAERRTQWQWYYEWLVPGSEPDALDQYISSDSGPIPAPHAAPTKPTFYVVDPRTPTTQKGKGAEPYDATREQIAEWRDLFGDVLGNIEQPYSAMRMAVGKELDEIRYQTLAEVLSGAVTAIHLDEVEMVYGPQPAFARWLATVADEAAVWDRRVSMKDTLILKAASYRQAAALQPAIEPVDQPPLPETQPLETPGQDLTLAEAKKELAELPGEGEIPKEDFPADGSGVASKPKPSSSTSTELTAPASPPAPPTTSPATGSKSIAEEVPLAETTFTAVE